MKITKKQLIKHVIKEFKDTFEPQSKEISDKELEQLLNKQNFNSGDVNIDIKSAQEYLIKKMKTNEIRLTKKDLNNLIEHFYLRIKKN